MKRLALVGLIATMFLTSYDRAIGYNPVEGRVAVSACNDFNVGQACYDLANYYMKFNLNTAFEYADKACRSNYISRKDVLDSGDYIDGCLLAGIIAMKLNKNKDFILQYFAKSCQSFRNKTSCNFMNDLLR